MAVALAAIIYSGCAGSMGNYTATRRHRRP